MPRAINFHNLGYHVQKRRPPVTQAARNNTAFFLNPYATESKLISPRKTQALYAKCNDILYPLLDAAGIARSRIKLWIVEEKQPNAWIFKGTGDICVTTSLLEKEDLTQGELASVLAHELGHYLKSKPGRKMPKRFKNPLFRDYALGTAFAQKQNEEFEGDELGILIMDRAGFSVDEVMTMAEWLAGSNGRNGHTSREGTNVLRPGSSHPSLVSRIATIRALINHPKFVWKNKNAPKEKLLNQDAAQQIKNKKLRDLLGDFERAVLPGLPTTLKTLDLLNMDTVNDIALRRQLKESSIVLDFYKLLAHKDLGSRNKIKDFILKIKKQIQEGDLVSSAYLKALLCKLYFETVKNGRAPKMLAWLKKDCGIKTEEVMLALLALIESVRSEYFNYLKASLKDKVVVFSSSEEIYYDCTFEEIVMPFSHSSLRDKLIFGLLRTPHIITDTDNYFDIVFSSAYSLYTSSNTAILFALRWKQLKKILQLLHGASFDYTEILRGDEVSALISRINDEAQNAGYFDLDRTVDHSGPYSSSHSYSYSLLEVASIVLGLAAPYDRARLESLLEENVSMHILYPKDTYKFQYLVRQAYLHMKEKADNFKETYLRKRILKFCRIVLLKHLEAIPAEEWDKETIAIVESLPPSSEKNHLLIPLHKSGRRKLSDSELVFEEIPRPDEIDAYGENLTLLNSFGFIDPYAAEAVYPSGQRILDKFKAERLPQEGRLTVNQVRKTIPRPSPGRDELLDRIPVKGIKQAKTLLDSYWSPAAAYAKAYQIARSWIDNLKEGDQKVFRAICRITEEFPSLRRRMVREWTDRFGILKDDYRQILKSSSDVDAIDVYKGGTLETTREGSILAKLSICLASFASALSRKDSSLMSIQELDTKGTSQVEQFLTRNESEDKPPEKVFDRTEREKDAHTAIFEDYSPFLPENAAAIARLLLEESPFLVHSIPFIDNKPSPNPRFERNVLTSETLTEMKKWEGGKLFSNFIQAMGWEEAIAFYEELFIGREGIAHDPDLFQNLENIFIQGIGLLLQEKKVPLARVDTVKKGIQSLLANQPVDIRVQVWTRILAGIAQKQSLGEITREAVRPLKAAGGKLMQSIHSLTTGIDPTLEEATRLALDQTASFSLLDGIQFLAFRQSGNPFNQHTKYTLLGQGTVRVALGGLEGPSPEEAFLLVHAGQSDPRVINGISKFINQTTSEGHYFPLTARQFKGLVEQTEEERRRGFDNHIGYGELFNWKLGQVSIPRVLEHNGDWARVELVAGVPYTALEPKRKKAVAKPIIDAAFAQLQSTTPEGTLKINPEFHPGNLIIGRDQSIWLVDCGLIGEATPQDSLSLFSTLASFRSQGLAGAAASLLQQGDITSLAGIKEDVRKQFTASLRTMSGQAEAGTSPELLLPSLSGVVHKAGGPEVTPGIETLFRAVQHLAPYIRDLGKIPTRFTSMLAQPQPSALASEIQKAMTGGQERITHFIPRGMAVGKRLRDGQIATIGVLTRELNPDESPYPGMVECRVEGLTQYVKREDIVIQKGTDWVTLSDFRKG